MLKFDKEKVRLTLGLKQLTPDPWSLAADKYSIGNRVKGKVVSLMDYGFFGPGEGKDFFAHGRTAPGGELPVNTSGGLLSEVYQQGFTPLTEAAVQLQGRAGARQLGPVTKTKEPKIMLVSGNGGTLQNHATVILGNELA